MKFLSRFFSCPTGFGTAGIRRQREEGSLTVIGTSGTPQRGVETTETGISVASFEVHYFPQIRESLLDNLGEIRNWFVSTVCSREVTIEGEVLSGASGIMAFTFLAACSVSNDIVTWGSPTGGLYMVDAREIQSRATPRRVVVMLRSDPGVT